MFETEPVDSEMVIPTVIAGISVEQEKTPEPVPNPYYELFLERVERPDFHDLCAAYAENAPPDPEPSFKFQVPANATISHIARQSNAQFQKMGWKKRLAIVGFADSKKDAPYDDPSWEIWGLNDLHNSIPRWTRWFDIHTFDNINEDVKLGRSPADKCGIGGLARLSCPVYMQDKIPEVPNSVKFPLEEILETFKGRSGERYFTNSVSYMIAYALYEGLVSGRQWDEIHIYGVDMAVGVEYIAQRPSCEYWIGIAEGMGVKVFIPVASDLNKCAFLYGFEAKKQKAFETKVQEGLKSIESRANQIKAAIDQNTAIYHEHLGAIGMGKECLKIWANCDTRL